MLVHLPKYCETLGTSDIDLCGAWLASICIQGGWETQPFFRDQVISAHVVQMTWQLYHKHHNGVSDKDTLYRLKLLFEDVHGWLRFDDAGEYIDLFSIKPLRLGPQTDRLQVWYRPLSLKPHDIGGFTCACVQEASFEVVDDHALWSLKEPF